MGANYEQLNCEERTMIQLSLEQGCKLRAIARSLQRAPSSISRELRRNGWCNPATLPPKPGRPQLVDATFANQFVQAFPEWLRSDRQYFTAIRRERSMYPVKRDSGGCSKRVAGKNIACCPHKG